MLRRLILGLVIGLVIGGALAFGLVRLGEMTFAGAGGDMLAYLSAAAAGALTGLVAGKPIWASGARIEGGLKALFGALLAVGGMFALRQWASGFEPNLTALGGGGPLPVGELPMASLPLIAAGLGGLFGIDNTEVAADARGTDRGGPSTRKRVAASAGSKSRIAEVEDGEDAEASPKRAKR
jgi:hypothetical protein